MRDDQTRNNNGQARARGGGFCENAANENTSLLDDLRFNAESTSYAGRDGIYLNRWRINGLQNPG
jgi:hypothetical protein